MNLQYKLITTLRKTPLVLQGIILQVLKNWFKLNSDQFKWSDNDLESRLVIEPMYQWNPENCQNRPGVYIRRLSYIPKGQGKAGMNDLLSIGKHSETQHLVLPVCPMGVVCVSKLPGEAEKLAWEISELFIALSPIIKRDFGFTDFNVDQISEISKMEESKEFWMVNIQLTLKFSEAWEIQEVTPVLKDILIQAYTNISKCEE